jgi:DNA-binding GntR family transcriptional regulator
MARDIDQPFTRLHQPSLVERVATDLRQAIVEGRLRPGDKLSDARIAADMGLSRAPVREAIRRLAAQGLVEEAPRRGAFVSRLSRVGVHEIYDCRRALEGIAARRVAVMQPAAALAALDDIVETEMEDVARRRDAVGMADADGRFHRALVAAAANEWLDRLYAQIADQMRLISTLDNTAHPGADVAELAAIHRPVVAALRAGDPDAAETVTLRHIDTAERLFMDAVGDVLDSGDGPR